MDQDRDGVPLAHYLTEHPGCGVRFYCTSCAGNVYAPVGQVVARLKARGLGDEGTGIRAVARFAERPCARCGAMRWETMPAFGLARD